MRCLFLRQGHVVDVETLPGLSDLDAIAKAHSLFSNRKAEFDGFEVWDRIRMVFSHPDPSARK
jgi:hypothetical protein